MASKGLGWFEGRWIGDTDTVGFENAGRAMGVETRSRPEANAMFDYLKSKKRDPQMFTYVFDTMMAGLKTVYAVYWLKKDIQKFKGHQPKAKVARR